MLTKLYTAVLARIDGEDGQALAEYGLVLALVALAALFALTALGLAVAGQLDVFAAAFGS